MKINEKQLRNIIKESVKKILKETIGKMVLRYYIPRVGWNTMHVNSIEEAKPYIKDAIYWDISKGNNTSEPENLVAWAGDGGYWSNYINKPSWATEKTWSQPSQRIIDLILSKKVD